MSNGEPHGTCPPWVAKARRLDTCLCPCKEAAPWRSQAPKVLIHRLPQLPAETKLASILSYASNTCDCLNTYRHSSWMLMHRATSSFRLTTSQEVHMHNSRACPRTLESSTILVVLTTLCSISGTGGAGPSNDGHLGIPQTSSPMFMRSAIG
jgi:hypothetical protein